MSRLLLFSFLLIILISAVYTLQLYLDDNIIDQKSEIKSIEKEETSIVEPVKDFKARITKKPFGILITPETSPIQPERFSGYHTGVDVEYGDVKDDVVVLAVADGLVKYSGWVVGYGGVIAIRHQINNKEYLAVYGHLNPATLITKGKVIKGEQIGILGQENSTETDNERKHLHFALYIGKDLNLKGYVEVQNQLSDWINPMIIFFSK